jgi:hypothetical protein
MTDSHLSPRAAARARLSRVTKLVAATAVLLSGAFAGLAATGSSHGKKAAAKTVSQEQNQSNSVTPLAPPSQLPSESQLPPVAASGGS